MLAQTRLNTLKMLLDTEVIIADVNYPKGYILKAKSGETALIGSLIYSEGLCAEDLHSHNRRSDFQRISS